MDTYIYLFRKALDAEIKAMCRYFRVECKQENIPTGSLIIPIGPVVNKSTLLNENAIKFINDNFYSDITIPNYVFTTDIRAWYPTLKQYTFKTYFKQEALKLIPEGEYIVRKVRDGRRVFCENKRIAYTQFFKNTPAVVRDYPEQVHYGRDSHYLYINREYRIYIFLGKVQYASFVERAQGFPPPPDHFKVPWGDKKFCTLLLDMVKKIGKSAKWYTLNIVQLSDGNWILRDITNGHQSPIINLTSVPDDFDLFYKMLLEIQNDAKSSA